MSKQRRIFRLLQAAGELRTATHAPGDPDDQREHLVVPLIALVEGVIHPVNAKTPELVLEAELAEVAEAWNGEPATWNHPEENGKRISANAPKVLEAYQVGKIFNARVENKQLRVEAWIDKARALSMGGDAAALVDRIEAGEMIEVSVGAFVITEPRTGMHSSGKRFAQVWREIYPDHIALLPAGETGACSNEMGCGAPRTASLHTLSEDGSLLAPNDANSDRGPEMNEPSRLTKLLERVRTQLGSLRSGQDSKSDSDIRALLSAALFNTEPAFLGVTEVFQVEMLVVYETGADGSFQLFQRPFEISDDDIVTFGEAVEGTLEIETKFVPVTAAGAADSGKGKNAADSGTPGETDMDKAARVAALIDNKATRYCADDRDALVALSDDTLKHLEEVAAKPAEEVKDPPAEGAETPPVEAKGAEGDPPADETPEGDPPADAEPMTAEAWMAAAPDDIREDLVEMRAAKARNKADLIAQLLAADADDVFTEKQLGEKGQAELEQLAKFCKVEVEAPTFIGRPAPKSATASEDDDKPAPPPSLKAAMDARRGAATTN